MHNIMRRAGVTHVHKRFRLLDRSMRLLPRHIQLINSYKAAALIAAAENRPALASYNILSLITAHKN